MYKIRQYLITLSQFHSSRMWVIQILGLSIIGTAFVTHELSALLFAVLVVYSLILRRNLIFLVCIASIFLYVLVTYIFGSVDNSFDIITMYTLLMWIIIQTFDIITKYELVQTD